MSFVRRFTAAALVTVTLSGCASLRSDPGQSVARDFVAALDSASLEVRGGRYGMADHLLEDFAAKYPGSSEATETLYWRALFKADPANQVALIKESLPLLDSYLAAPATATVHRTEGAALKRLVVLVESRPAAPAPTVATAPAAPAAKADDHSRDEEVSKLKEELQRANAELERIKRRLAQPRP